VQQIASKSDLCRVEDRLCPTTLNYLDHCLIGCLVRALKGQASKAAAHYHLRVSPISSTSLSQTSKPLRDVFLTKPLHPLTSCDFSKTQEKVPAVSLS
jgi:hypothetical protein